MLLWGLVALMNNSDDVIGPVNLRNPGKFNIRQPAGGFPVRHEVGRWFIKG
jgi:hypothetical protein